MTERNENAEELLETLWLRTEEGQESSVALDEIGSEKVAAEQLGSSGHVTLADNRIALTNKGRTEAKSVVRRHRLAERLLADVLGTSEDAVMHEKACKFEHLLDKGLDDNICILLGHPKICPHGKPIPPGNCCLQNQKRPQKVVMRLSEAVLGQKGRVAYIHAPESGQLQKLMAMGVLPGAPISLVQRFPSYVFQAGQSQFAVDKEIADSIYVRLVEEESAGQAEEPGGQKRRRRFGVWGRR